MNNIPLPSTYKDLVFATIRDHTEQHHYTDATTTEKLQQLTAITNFAYSRYYPHNKMSFKAVVRPVEGVDTIIIIPLNLTSLIALQGKYMPSATLPEFGRHDCNGEVAYICEQDADSEYPVCYEYQLEPLV
jgi:hypothetical protein